MGLIDTKEGRGYIGSSVIFLLVIGILIFLSFYPIPEENNDVVKLLIGMIAGSLGTVIIGITGRNPEELEALKISNTRLKEENKGLRERVDHLEEMFINLQGKIVSDLSVLSANAEIGFVNPKVSEDD